MPLSLLGGQGGRGSRGIKCRLVITACFYTACAGICNGNGQTAEAARGPRGDNGEAGQGSILILIQKIFNAACYIFEGVKYSDCFKLVSKLLQDVFNRGRRWGVLEKTVVSHRLTIHWELLVKVSVCLQWVGKDG